MLQLQLRVLVPKDGSKDIDDQTKRWISTYLKTPKAAAVASDSPSDAVCDSLIDRGQLVILTSSGALLRVPVGLLGAAYDIGQEKVEVQAVDPAILHLKQMQSQLDRFAKAVAEREKEFEKQNTIRYEANPEDEVGAAPRR